MTDFQARSVRVGRSYEQQVGDWLNRRGFTIEARNVRHECGVEFDILAADPFGQPLGVECKASDDSAPEGSRGMRRSDNRWKVLGYLYRFRLWRMQNPQSTLRYVLFTSDMPEIGTEARESLDIAEALGDITVIVVPYDAVTVIEVAS